MKNLLFLFLFFFWIHHVFGQSLIGRQYQAGFTSIELSDSKRLWKPGVPTSDSLYHRPVDIDIWYPTLDTLLKPVLFDKLFEMFESRAIKYQEMGEGLTDELALYISMELGLDTGNTGELLQFQTNSFPDAKPAEGPFPVIIYMAGFNGMGYENFRIIENLTQNGYVVISIWSMGRYPGSMTNEKADMMEQVYDAEFAIESLKKADFLDLDWEETGILGCSWGGMSAAAYVKRNTGVKAFASLDGTETHYFGQSDLDDELLKDIYDHGLIDAEGFGAAYLYLESDNKWQDFKPSGEYHYFKKAVESKYYLRLLGSRHEDFLSFPSMVNSRPNSTEIHNKVIGSVRYFFDQYLKGEAGFAKLYSDFSLDNSVNTLPKEFDFDLGHNFLISGITKDASSKKPLSYVNLSILGKDLGTVSNAKGEFKLVYKEANLLDTIRFSMIGYKPKEKLVKDLIAGGNSFVCELEEDVSQLTEIVVGAKPMKTKNLGNKTESRFVGTAFGFDKLGTEIGVKINVTHNPTYVDNFNFYLSYNFTGARTIFRLNIYDLQNGNTGKNILTQNIFITVEKDQTGLISIDLRDYNIVLENDALVTMEWVDNEGDVEVKKGAALVFSLGFFTSGTYVKQTKDSKMKKMASLGVGFNMDVRY